MHADETFLLRFLQAADQLPADVRAWSLGLIFGALPARQRKCERDRLLRAAAALLPADLAPWQKAAALHGEVESTRRACPADPSPATPRGCVALAMLVCPGRELSQRQIYRAIR